MCPFIQLIQLIHRKKIFKEVQDMKRVTIGGIRLNDLRYADDTALLCFCPTDLQELLNAFNKAGKPYGMEMNIIKTKATVVRQNHPNTPNQHYTWRKTCTTNRQNDYLGSHKTKDGKCEKEIRRTELARSTFEKMSKALTFPIIWAVLALDSWNYCSEEQAWQPNICKIPQSSLYSWTMYINNRK